MFPCADGFHNESVVACYRYVPGIAAGEAGSSAYSPSTNQLLDVEYLQRRPRAPQSRCQLHRKRESRRPNSSCQVGQIFSKLCAYENDNCSIKKFNEPLAFATWVSSHSSRAGTNGGSA